MEQQEPISHLEMEEIKAAQKETREALLLVADADSFDNDETPTRCPTEEDSSGMIYGTNFYPYQPEGEPSQMVYGASFHPYSASTPTPLLNQRSTSVFRSAPHAHVPNYDGYDYYPPNIDAACQTSDAASCPPHLHALQRSSTLSTQKDVASLLFGFDDDDNDEDNNDDDIGVDEFIIHAIEDLEQSSSTLHTNFESNRNEVFQSAPNQNYNIKDTREIGHRIATKKSDHRPPIFEKEGEEVPSMIGSARSISSDRVGAFRTSGRDATVQRKGVLTLLEENSQPMLYSQLSSAAFPPPGASSVDGLDETTPEKSLCGWNQRRVWWIWIAAPVLLIIAVATMVWILVFVLDDKADVVMDASPIAICIEYGEKTFPHGQPDIHCQCELQGEITSILDSTRESYRDVQKRVNGSSSAGSPPSLSSGDVGFHLVNESSCDDARNVALLDLASRNSTDLERYGLMVLYLSMGVLFSEWSIISNRMCDWPGISCDRNGVTTYGVRLSSSYLKGTLPTEIGFLSNMRKLDIAGNSGLIGTIPTELGTLNGLRYIRFNTCDFSGTLPTQIGSMTSLETLNLGRNSFTGPLPSEIGKLQKLNVLNTEENSLVGTVPTELMQLSSLNRLALWGNGITGTIPKEISALTKLTFLDLMINALQGTIPWSGIAGMTDLNFLNLGKNFFNSTLPSAIGQLTALRMLQMTANDIEGVIPTEIGLLTMLTTLVLDMNRFSGSIPSTLANLSNLTLLRLESNKVLFGDMEAFCESVTAEQAKQLYVVDTMNYQILCSCCDWA